MYIFILLKYTYASIKIFFNPPTNVDVNNYNIIPYCNIYYGLINIVNYCRTLNEKGVIL